jgi:hypothetical protein
VILDIFRGKAVTIPPLDGLSEHALDDAPAFAELTEPDNLLVLMGAAGVQRQRHLLVGAAPIPR